MRRVLLAIVILAAGCSGGDSAGLEVDDPWARPNPNVATNAAFFSGSAQKVGPLMPGDYQIQLYRPGNPPVRHPLTVGGQEEMHLQLSYSPDER